MNVVNILLVILMFSLLIFVHELGHFLVAKLNKVDVEEFSFGFGSKLFGVKYKGTEYNVKCLPFGGSVEMNVDPDDENSLLKKKPLQRIAILIAGPLMSLLFGIFLFVLVTCKYGYTEPIIAEVQQGKPAVESGLKKGDKIISINGKHAFTSDDVSYNISESKNNPIKINYLRDGKENSVTVTPKMDNTYKRYMIGMSFSYKRDPSVIESIKYSFNKSISETSMTFSALKKLFTGRGNVKTDVGGPVTIVRMSSEAAKNGIWTLLNFTAFISVQLAVMNLLPFPALDGGRILIDLVELITRKKLPEKAVEYVNTAGFVILMILMVLIMIKDIIYPIKF